MKKEYVHSGRQNQKLRTRRKILESAKHLMKDGGPFTLEEVAEHADISRATIYRYFSNVELLSHEAGLDISTKTPSEIIGELTDPDIVTNLKAIQQYFNQLTLDNETAFRKYLSLVIDVKFKGKKRGARRFKTIKALLKNSNWNLSKDELKKFSVAATALMGVESIIVAKDVCGLGDQEAVETLQWGLELMTAGLKTMKNIP